MTDITVSLNGENRQFKDSLSLKDLLSELGLDARKVAVERNRVIAPRSQYDQILIESGDQLEIVQFVGGG